MAKLGAWREVLAKAPAEGIGERRLALRTQRLPPCAAALMMSRICQRPRHTALQKQHQGSGLGQQGQLLVLGLDQVEVKDDLKDPAGRLHRLADLDHHLKRAILAYPPRRKHADAHRFQRHRRALTRRECW